MNFTEIDIKNIVESILKHFKLEYYKDKDFTIRFTPDDKAAKRYGIYNSWECYVDTENIQFGTDDGVYAFSISDDPPHKILMIDGSGGRGMFYFIKKNSNGTYSREWAEPIE